MFIPMGPELEQLLGEIAQIPETPMDDEFWNTPEVMDAECIDMDTDGDQLYTINLSPDGKTCRQVDRYEKYDKRTNLPYCSHVVVNVLVGPELFGRIDKLYHERMKHAV